MFRRHAPSPMTPEHERDITIRTWVILGVTFLAMLSYLVAFTADSLRCLCSVLGIS